MIRTKTKGKGRENLRTQRKQKFPITYSELLVGKRGKKGWRNTNQGGGFSKINQNTESKICGCQRREWEENGHNHATSLKITC